MFGIRDIKALNVMILFSGFMAMVMSTMFSWILIDRIDKVMEKVKYIIREVQD